MSTYQSKDPVLPRKPDLSDDQRDNDLAMLAYAKQLEAARRKNAVAVTVGPHTVVITTPDKVEKVCQRHIAVYGSSR